MISVRERFPEFKLQAAVSLEKGKEFKELTHKDFKGKWLVVFFWPMDFTFVCPTEIAEFGKRNGDFLDRDAQVLGASTDSHFVHLAWRREHPDLKNLSFAGSTNRFFGAFLHPLNVDSRAVLVRVSADTVPARPDPDSNTAANTVTRALYTLSLPIPARSAETKVSFGLYLGPKSYHVFEELADPARFAPILDVDLTAPCCVVEVPGGRLMAKILLTLLGWFHGVIGNWGFAIIMLTILVRGLLAPLNFHMQKSMRAYGARMAVLKPKLEALKCKYGDDQKAYQQAMVAFQREHKMIPPDHWQKMSFPCRMGPIPCQA